MNYSLKNQLLLSSGSSIKNAVILCHGYGGDGKDISIVANYWKNFLPNTLFIFVLMLLKLAKLIPRISMV